MNDSLAEELANVLLSSYHQWVMSHDDAMENDVPEFCRHVRNATFSFLCELLVREYICVADKKGFIECIRKGFEELVEHIKEKGDNFHKQH